jgi:acylpyruvate hydrolase
MRLLRYTARGSTRIGAAVDGMVIDLDRAIERCGRARLVASGIPSESPLPPGDMVSFLAAGLEVIAKARAAIEAIREELHRGAADATQSGTAMALAEVQLKAPLANPGKLICAWINYPHPKRPAQRRADPLFFAKFPATIIGPGDRISLPDEPRQVVIEPELAVVIGKDGRNIAARDAFAHVAGYTILNDVTDLTWRLEEFLGTPGPYLIGKNCDTFAPMGPFLVTAEEVPDPQDLSVKAWINGELILESSTAGMIFPVSHLVSYLSRFFTLRCGDVIATGSPTPTTPMKPRPLLKPGDAVRIEIERIGVLENPVALWSDCGEAGLAHRGISECP